MNQKNVTKVGAGKNRQEKKQLAKNLINNLAILAQLSKRMALKLYLYNSKDEIFIDGTFDKKTLEAIKKEAMTVKKALKYKMVQDKKVRASHRHME